MRFNVEVLEELIYCYPGEKLDGFEVIQREYVDSGRWMEHWTQVLKYKDKFYRVDFELPATEMQEQGQSAYEMSVDCDGWVEAVEVFPFEEVITVYRSSQ